MTSDGSYITETGICSDTVEAQALAWLAQLDGGALTAQDQKAFQEWISRSPVHAQKMQELSLLWGELNVLTDMIEPIASADWAAKSLRKKRNIRNGAIAFASAAAAICLMSGFFFQKTFNLNQPQDVEQKIASVELPIVFKTDIGEQETHILQDGSSIILNTNSHVEVDYNQGSRRIRLLRGETFFDVAHDQTRPFLVFAGDGLVQALGTAFVVKLDEDENFIDVIVSEGSVELSSVNPYKENGLDAGSSLSSLGIVKAGSSAKIYEKQASIQPMAELKIIENLSWKDGMLTFTGQSLDTVIQEVSRYTKLDIIFADEKLQDLQIGGVYPVNDTQTLLLTLEENFGVISDTSVPGKIILSSKQ